MRASDRMGIAVTVAVVLAAFTLRPLTQDRSWVVPAILFTVVIGVVSLVLRRLHVVTGAVFVAQVLILVGGVLATAASLPPIRADGFVANLLALIPAAAQHMQQQAAPMTPDTGVTFLLIVSVGVIAVLTDLMASTLQRVVWSFAPLATLYLVPALGLVGDIGTVDFVLIAIGYLGILVADGTNTTARWTRGLTRDSASGIGNAEPVVLRAALWIGIPALVLAIIGGLLVPTFDFSGIGGGRGNQGPLQLTDPTADLRRNLNQPENRVVLRYQTDAPGGEYLRLTSLPLFDSRGFQNPTLGIRSGTLPAPPGLTSPGAVVRTTKVQVGDAPLPSGYLLAPYAPTSYTAAGDWVYDPNSLVILSARNGTNLRGLSYEVKSLEIAPDGAALARAGTARPADADLTADVPADLPDSIRKKTEEVIRGATTPAARAAAIQAFLRSPEFTYDTRPQPGSGYDALERFLLGDKRGYCEQFAGAMAVMARIAGIPSRFAVGFLPGKKVGDSYEVSINNYHAWPELYFAGFGWVRYEPTPGVGVAPAWSLPRPTDEESSASAQPSASASDTTSAGPVETAVPSESTGPVGQTEQSTPAQVIAVAGLLLGVLVVLALLALPALWRLRVRRRRLSPAGTPSERVEAGWSELRDTKLDLRSSWPAGSPRAIAREVGRDLDPDDRAAMTRLGTLVERSRYARTFDDADDVGEISRLTTQVRGALLAPHAWTRRLPATVAPRSLWLHLRTRWFGRRG